MVPVLIAVADSLQKAMRPLASRFPHVEFRFCEDGQIAENLTRDVVVLAGEDLPAAGTFDLSRIQARNASRWSRPLEIDMASNMHYPTAR